MFSSADWSDNWLKSFYEIKNSFARCKGREGAQTERQDNIFQ